MKLRMAKRDFRALLRNGKLTITVVVTHPRRLEDAPAQVGQAHREADHGRAAQREALSRARAALRGPPAARSRAKSGL